MTTTYDRAAGTWNIAWPNRVARHDLVFLTPPEDPLNGLPIGNGEVGLLAWFEPSRVIFVMNRSDLWDDAKFGRFRNWHAEEEEFSTTLRHGCRILLDFKLPVFDTFYLKDFSARINLADASIDISAVSVFGRVKIRALIDHTTGTLRADVTAKLSEPTPTDISLQRFGSRIFSHWYSRVRCEPELGLTGTHAHADANTLAVTHKLTSGTFAAAAHIDLTAGKSQKSSTTTKAAAKNKKLTTRIDHTHQATASIAADKNKSFTLFATITEPSATDPLPIARKQLASAQRDAATLLAAHKKSWKAFWLRSFLEFDDAYIDALWHLTMFYAACSQRGKYPGRFISGLWGWNRDVQNWSFYFHWNQQQTYWPLNAAGHHDLITSYLNYRFAGLTHATDDAKAKFGVDGAIVSDVCERRGYNSENEFHNHTPVAQIAMEFYRQYKFTGDENFLRTQLWPYIRQAALFFETRFEKKSDNRYHAIEGTGYEGWILLNDPITEIACAETLFAAALDTVRRVGEDHPHAAHWQDILDHLTPLPTQRVTQGFLANGKINRGWFKGAKALGNHLLMAGFGVKEKQWMTSMLPEPPAPPFAADLVSAILQFEGKPALADPYRDDMRCNDGIFPWAEYSTVFPCGPVTLAHKNTDRFNTVVDTVRAIACPGMGWLPLGVTLARLGLADEARKCIDLWPMYWQFYTNGWGHYGPLAIMRSESILPTRTSHMGIRDTALPDDERENHPLSARLYPFRHMGMEAMSAWAVTVNESLLQSHDDTIRVAPAATKTQNARFTLHAQNGFVVSSQIESGQPLWIALKSTQGQICRISIPWKTATLFAGDKKLATLTAKDFTKKSSSSDATIRTTRLPSGELLLEFATTADAHYTLVPDAAMLRRWKSSPSAPDANTTPLTHWSGATSLGSTRQFA